MTQLFPHLPLHLNFIVLFGLTLLLGIIGGEIARRIPFLPRISGYMLIGLLAGPGGLNIVNHSVLAYSRIFVDISLSLILFNLGRQLDFTWLRYDRSLLLTSVTESGLTFALIYSVLYFFIDLPGLQAALGATIAVATSPAVVMMVANDLSSEGPVTRRALILTSLNNLFGLILFTLLLPMTQYLHSSDLLILADAMYRIFGSIILGLGIFIITKLIAYLTGKQKENQFALFVGVIILTIGLAYMLRLSSMLSLFILGVAARNLDFGHSLMEIDFGWLARVLFILLFVITGVHLQLQGLWYASGAVILFLVARTLTKICGVMIFYKKCRLTVQQAFALGLTLLPMAGVAIGMYNVLIDFIPDLGQSLLIIITAVIAVLNIIGPVVTQFAFIKTGEAISTPLSIEDTK